MNEPHETTTEVSTVTLVIYKLRHKDVETEKQRQQVVEIVVHILGLNFNKHFVHSKQYGIWVLRRVWDVLFIWLHKETEKETKAGIIV